MIAKCILVSHWDLNKPGRWSDIHNSKQLLYSAFDDKSSCLSTLSGLSYMATFQLMFWSAQISTDYVDLVLCYDWNNTIQTIIEYTAFRCYLAFIDVNRCKQRDVMQTPTNDYVMSTVSSSNVITIGMPNNVHGTNARAGLNDHFSIWNISDKQYTIHNAYIYPHLISFKITGS